MIPDLIGHFGYILLALGTFLLGKNRKTGWLFRIIGEILWIGIGLHINMTSIVLWGFIFIYLDIKGYITWQKRLA